MPGMLNIRPEPPGRGGYEQLSIINSSVDDTDQVYDDDDDDDALLLVGVASYSDTQSNLELETSNPGLQLRVLQPKSLVLQKPKTKCMKVFSFILTSLACSCFIILFTSGISIGPGLYAILVVKPEIVVDKSVQSFQIPNHESSRRYDAYKQAIVDARSGYVKKTRKKRSLHENIEYQGDVKNMVSMTEEDPNTFYLHKYSKNNVKKELKKFLTRLYYDELYEGEESQDLGNEILSRYSDTHTNRSVSSDFSDVIFSSHRSKRATQRTQYHRRWKMQIVYLAQGEDKNIFTKERLETIHKIERESVMGHPNFKKFCYISYKQWSDDPNLSLYDGCMPLNSLMTYFYPSKTKDGRIHYDSLGDNLDQINRTLKFAMTRSTFYWYVDDSINSSNLKSRLLRSEVHFGTPIAGYSSINEKRPEQTKKYLEFLYSYIDVLEKVSTDKVQVLYGSNEIFDYEVSSTFWNDVFLAAFAFGSIFVVMLVLTSFSVWLTLMGLFTIVLSFPIAFFFYRVVFGIKSLGILNGAAAFVIIGIGVDDVFVFINTFRQSPHIEDLGDRLQHTLLTAGKATFFTSFTTAAAFAANVASSIPAVHEFGLFMSLIVAACWVTVVLMMPPVINIWYRSFARLERCCFKPCSTCGVCEGRLEMPSDIVNFLDSNKTTSSAASDSSSDSDVPMLLLDNASSIEGDMLTGDNSQNMKEDSFCHDDDNNDNDDDEPLLRLDDEPLIPIQQSNPVAHSGGCSLTKALQCLLYFYVAKPVVKGRWFIFVAFIIIFGVSIGLMTQLKPATKPPQLFRATTNLQMLLDLAANFSDSGISCDDCSGIYKERPVSVTTQKPRTVPNTPPMRTTTQRIWTRPTQPKTTTKRTTTKRPTTTTKRPTITTTRSTTQRPITTITNMRTTTSKRPTTTQKTSERTTTRSTPSTKKNTTPKPAKTTVTNPRPTTTVQSTDPGYDPCADGKCDNAESRPNLELGAAVYVVFGIKDIDRGNTSHNSVISQAASVVYDEKFEKHFTLINLNPQDLKDLCNVCKLISKNTDLVKPNASQCIPHSRLTASMRFALQLYPECKDLPGNQLINGRRLPNRANAGLTPTSLKWIAMAFESTTFKGQSSFSAYSDYQRWEKFLQEIRDKHLPKDSPLAGMYQTSDFWKQVMMEVIAVSSAIYGLVLSMMICVAAVAIFTGHWVLLMIVVSTILGVICLVVAIFYLVGWEMGAVEAVSLSILVGSSVDYCVHLVEGYLLAGTNPPTNILNSNNKLRRWRTKVAISHIGVSIVSSAITTIIAAIPLTQTIILPFSKFGQIVAINTTVSIFYTLTACTALLALFAPGKFKTSLKSTGIAFGTTAAVVLVILVILFGVSKAGIDIPGPNGKNLFPT